MLVEIPTDFLALKTADPTLALRWRMGMRAAFQALFQKGYAVTDFVREPGPRPRAVYVLTQTQAFLIHQGVHPMIIDRVTLYHLRMPLVAPFETSFGRITDRECILIEVAADGLIGSGEAWPTAIRAMPTKPWAPRGTSCAISLSPDARPGCGRAGRFPGACCARARSPDGQGWGGNGDLGYLGKHKTTNHYMNYLEVRVIV